MKKAFYFVIYIVVLFFCAAYLFSLGQGFALLEKITDNYYITAPDTDDQAALSFHTDDSGDIYSTIVDATVFAEGHNNKYMVLKQHPYKFTIGTNKTITNYFILPLLKTMDWKTKNGLMGPLTLDEFNKKRKELNIEYIQFTTVIKSVE